MKCRGGLPTVLPKKDKCPLIDDEAGISADKRQDSKFSVMPWERVGCYSVMGGSGNQGSKKPCLNWMLTISATIIRMMKTMV